MRSRSLMTKKRFLRNAYIGLNIVTLIALFILIGYVICYQTEVVARPIEPAQSPFLNNTTYQEPAAEIAIISAEAEPAQETEEENTEESSYEEPPTEIPYTEFTATAYCGCSSCCGAWATDPDHIIGSGGVELIQGYHVAAPFKNGTKLEIEGMGIYEVQDDTAQWIVEKYDGKIVDLYFDNHQDALNFGKRMVNVRVLNE